jgi:hypothetical protein
LEEVLYYERESPHRKYGAGLLNPGAPRGAANVPTEPADQAALQATDTIGAEPEAEGNAEGDDEPVDGGVGDAASAGEAGDDFEVTSPEVRHPSTIGISFCVRVERAGEVVIRLPQSRSFSWQQEDASPFAVNGRYEACTRRWKDEHSQDKDGPMWRRRPAVGPNAEVRFPRSDFVSGRTLRSDVSMPTASPLKLSVEVFPRQVGDDIWLLTVVLRNSSEYDGEREPRELVLYQTHFDVKVEGGRFERYPESRRPFDQLDQEEQSLALLYRESATWGIGHGCSAGWEAEPGQVPTLIFADVMPAVELPSMTPDIVDRHGNRIQLSMRDLASLPDSGSGPAWLSLDNLSAEYADWIQQARDSVAGLEAKYRSVATRHLEACTACLARINAGIALMRSDARVRRAFRLVNLAMLLQQIATKQLARRPLAWNAGLRIVGPQGEYRSPWDIYDARLEATNRLGSWRAFQIAFVLMSLHGVREELSPEREIVDLIWFPTGGGKTEAYLAVMAFQMFHERLLMTPGAQGPRRDGTNVLMRYTLRMLTTQQFQRAASLICAMEFIRRDPGRHGPIAGSRFSLGLWIGSAGAPNNIDSARTELNLFRRDDVEGNPLVLTECPWCRSEIGRYDGTRPAAVPKQQWNGVRTVGITDDPDEGPLLHCTDGRCSFGKEFRQDWLPVEVIDERIYNNPPSLVIATSDKFAMIAYRPAAGALFGRRFVRGEPRQECLPPSLIVQDELHLISGPLGTMYGLYEGVIERLCSYEQNGRMVRPKLIASTATIRGADDQVRSLYGRNEARLFPTPGLLMGDSFFGRYACDASGKLRSGRLYLGIHASDYGSVLTTQVRGFSAALFRPFSFPPDRRDPWWTLLAFYNSLRELGGAKTLFDSDIRSRLKFMFNREDFPHDARRNLRIIEELTSRLSQAEIVQMMDRLAGAYNPEKDGDTMDACLASNIIEVGVDIDRLSPMGVVGQPKTTATYIQVTGRVGRRWDQRPGLILMIYNPSKSRDRSHFEQFHSYHRRLYERVEPTSATPFAISAIQRALPGVLIAWARQQCDAPVQNQTAYLDAVESAYQLLRERCIAVQVPEDQTRSLQELDRVRALLAHKWAQNPQAWEEFPPTVDGEYLMLWPGQFATVIQKQRGVMVPSSMRQVDSSGELYISQGYVPKTPPAAPAPTTPAAPDPAPVAQ